MYNLLIVLMITIASNLALFCPTKLFAEAHDLEISIQNCNYAKKVAQTIMKKKSASRLVNYYEKLDFSSLVVMEIVFDAYNIDMPEDDFATKWYNSCVEFGCSDFWSGIDADLSILFNN